MLNAQHNRRSSQSSSEPVVHYPALRTSEPEIAIGSDHAANAQTLLNSTGTLGDSFTERMNGEIERLAPLYYALTDWIKFDQQAQALRKHLNISDADYQSLREKHRSITPVIYQDLLEQGESQGLSRVELTRVAERSSPVEMNIKSMAKIRMLLMKSILYSSPIFVRDFFDGKKINSGFGSAGEQVFKHKAETHGIRLSAVASPRVHQPQDAPEGGYVYRFAVAKFDAGGFEENRAVQMLDSRICDRLIAWHEANFKGTELSQNPLLSLAHSLNSKPIHDYIHSWFLYDAHAETDAFLQWGRDIFDVEHLSANDLLINYELLVGFMHNVSHRMLEYSNPHLRTSTVEQLGQYVSNVEQFGSWLQENSALFGLSESDVAQSKDYLVYVVASNLCLVHSHLDSDIAEILRPYPAVLDQMLPRIGDMAQFVNSDPQGVPSKRTDGDMEGTAEYILRYPLREEYQAALERQRIKAILDNAGAIDMAPFHAFAKLPESLATQFSPMQSITNPLVFPEIIGALERCKKDLGSDREDLYRALVSRIKFKDNHFFLELKRSELDLSKMKPVTLRKKTLLVRVPPNTTVTLRPQLIFGANNQLQKQEVTVPAGDFIGFNIRDDTFAQTILTAGQSDTADSIDISNMIQTAKSLGQNYGAAGALDIYPITSSDGSSIYKYTWPGIYQASEERLAVDTVGPIAMALRDNSLQHTLNGAIVYRNKDAPSPDTNPNCWAPEWSSFRVSYNDPTGKIALTRYQLQTLDEHNVTNSQVFHAALHRLHRSLRDINHMLDFGGFVELASNELYTQ